MLSDAPRGSHKVCNNCGADLPEHARFRWCFECRKRDSEKQRQKYRARKQRKESASC